MNAHYPIFTARAIRMKGLSASRPATPPDD
jgi:hypothetical protein